MIGHITGKIIFSDGVEVIVATNSGIGYQIYFNKILSEGSETSIYISHVIKEAGEELYGFLSLREKKLFEMLTSVKGVGPKSAYSLMSVLGDKQIIEAVTFESKKVLTKAPGVGPKAAAQMILDLKDKIQKVQMYGTSYQNGEFATQITESVDVVEQESIQFAEAGNFANEQGLLNDALMACKELGFREEKILPLAQKVLNENQVSRAEQLVHLVLKEV